MNASEKRNQHIKVFIRQRPLNKNEIESKCGTIIQKISSKELCIKSGYTEKKYNFDRVFGEEASQLDVYNVAVSPLIKSIISGYNCTVFAYGQTGTGKTHTIVGKNPADNNVNFHTDLSIGIIPRAAAHLFSELSKLNPRTEYTVRVSCIEIYNEEVRDLLNESTLLRLYDDPENKGCVYMKGLSEVTVCNTRDVYEWLNVGITERQTVTTNLNTKSSRSHILFTMLVNTREILSDGEELIKTGKLHLIDLAGSENIGRSGVVDIRAKEAATINKSLVTLGKVIKALSQKMQHIPYRDSKLTRILQDSLGGNTKTCMIGTISPATNGFEETVNTLDCAHNTRSIINCPQVNINKKQANFLTEIQQEIQKLQEELDAARKGSGFYVHSDTYEEMTQNLEESKEKLLELIEQITNLEECKRNKETEYENLNESLERTNSYLETAKQELQLKERKEKENEYVLNYVLKKDEELSKAANDLLKVCEISSKHEDVYYSKYQNQCDATLANANVVKNVTEISVNSLKEIQKLSDVHKQNQDYQIRQMQKSIKLFKDSTLQDVQRVVEIGSEIQSHFDEYKDLNSEDVLKHEKTDFSENNIQNYFTSLNVLQPKKSDKTKSSLKVLQNHIATSNEEIEKKSKYSLDMINDGLLQKGEYYITTKNMLEKIDKTVSDRYNYDEKRFEENRKIRSVIKEYISNVIKENEVLLSETSSLTKLMEDIFRMKQVYETKRLSENIKTVVSDYVECQSENAKTRLSLIDDVIDNFTEDHVKLENDMIGDKQNVDNYLSSLTSTIKENLSSYSNRMKGMFNNWKEKFSIAKENLFKTATENNETSNKNVELLSESVRNYESDIARIVEKATQEVVSLKENIIFTTHIGDTPVKTTYNYPKHIEKTVPKQVLLEQMRQILEEEE